MPHYRVEAWVTHKEHDFEDYLEEIITPLLRGAGMSVQGLVAFRIYPNGDPGRLPLCPTTQNRSSTDT